MTQSPLLGRTLLASAIEWTIPSGAQSLAAPESGIEDAIPNNLEPTKAVFEVRSVHCFQQSNFSLFHNK
jgi:hypothetical protein